MTSDGRIVAARSTIAFWMPWKCRKFFGHPYTAPGTTPNRFFIPHVMPAQWCVFSFGIEMTISASSTDTGSARSAQGHEAAAQRHAPHVVEIQVDERELHVAQMIDQAGRRDQVFGVSSMSRPLADDDLAGAGRGHRLRGGGDDRRCVLMIVPRSYSTMFGLRSTRLPLTSRASSRTARGSGRPDLAS